MKRNFIIFTAIIILNSCNTSTKEKLNSQVDSVSNEIISDSEINTNDSILEDSSSSNWLSHKDTFDYGKYINHNLSSLKPMDMDFYHDSIKGRVNTYVYYYTKQNRLYDYQPYTVIEVLSEASGYRVQLYLHDSKKKLIDNFTLSVDAGEGGGEYIQNGYFINDSTYYSIISTRYMISDNENEGIYQLDSIEVINKISKTGKIITNKKTIFSKRITEKH